MVNKKIVELFELSLRVNQETPFCVFVRMSGHCNYVEFDIAGCKIVTLEIELN